MRALSFWQPYAWLIVNGHADVDSRTWAPPDHVIGQRIAIHASGRKITRAEFNDFVQSMTDLGVKEYPQAPADFDYGKIVGTVIVAGVTKKSKSHWAANGYFHWILLAAQTIKPIPFKGHRSWFKVDI